MLRSNTEYGVSRFRCEHSGYDSALSQLQNGINKISLQLPASASRSLCKGSIPVDCEVYCFYTSNINLSCSSTLPSPPASQTPSLALRKGYDATIPLSIEAKEELHWWLAHLNAWNGRALLHPPPDIVIETDASRRGWGAVCQGVRTEGLWSQMERKLHINCLELLAGSFAVKSFTKIAYVFM